jgi:MoaA/NifB/PqqE/SkfB family radical SAM enzyme
VLDEMKIKCVIEITRKCFNSCSHCYLSCDTKGKDTPFRDILSISRKLSKPIRTSSGLIKFNIKSISGGDCFLYSDKDKNLIDVIDILANKNNETDLHVNGWVKSPEFLNKLKGKKISYYISYTPYTKNYRGLFEKCFIDLDSIDGKINIDIISKNSSRSKLLQELTLILKKQGYTRQSANSVYIFKKEKKKIKVFCKELFPIGRGSKIVKRTSKNYSCQYSNKKRSYFLYISSNGDLFPCARAPATKLIKIANILIDSKEDIAKNFFEYIKNKEIFIKKFNSKCQTCINYFNEWANEKIFSEASEKIAWLERKSRMLSAEKIALKFLKIALKNKNYKFIAEFYKDLSIIERIRGNLKKSEKLIKESLKASKKGKAKTQEANAYGNIGILNLFYKNYKIAIGHHRKALKIHYLNKDKKRISANLSFLGINYMFIKKYKSSLSFFKESIKMARRIGYEEGVADTMYNLSVFYAHLQNYKKSKNCLEVAKRLFKKIGNTYKLKQVVKLNLYIQDIENGKRENIILSDSECN